MVGFNNCKLSYITLNDFYEFHIAAEKTKDENNKKIIQNTRSNEDIDYKFKIPIDSFIFSETKPYYKNSEKGLITFKYRALLTESVEIDFKNSQNKNEDNEVNFEISERIDDKK